MCEDKIRFGCTDCGGRLNAPANRAGKQATCPRCGATVSIPESLDDIMDRVALLGLVPDAGAVPDESPPPAADRRANRRPAKPPDDDDEPKPGEWTVRCYDCGRRVSEKRAVRRNVTTGGWYGGSGRYSTSGRYTGRVDLCRACARQRDDYSRNLGDALLKAFLVFVVGILIAVPLGLVLVAVWWAIVK
jgi:hypothetical protein